MRKSYDGKPAVAGIDLEVAEGEVFALLGPNGAGKSTTVEILEGLRRRDGGEVSVLGQDPAKAPRSWYEDIGVVQQAATDLADTTVAEAVRHFARYYRRARAVDEVIDLVGLTEKAGDRAGKLSGGQRRRLDVALGIVGRPKLLFLDEPTTGFDPEARRRFWSLIRLLAREGTTIVLTTHYLDEVEALANRLAVVARGRVVAEGTPLTVGGRHTADALVSWIDNRGPQSYRTPRPDEFVRSLPAAPGLTVTRPTLEDVYLELIA
ncbi:ABC transporter ATP-binding protein [Saccharothrix violaceirubra]